MKSPAVEVRKAETSWSQKIAKAREMRGRSMGLLFDRASLLSDVYEDQEFLDSFATTDEALDALDIEVADTCCGWIELHGILKMFPDRKQWLSGHLQDLRAQREVAEKERRLIGRQNEGQSITREPRPTREQVQQLKTETEQARTKVAEVSQRADTQEKQIERLLQENSELRRQLHMAQGRIEELERIANRG